MALDKASELSSRELNNSIAAHVNWFNPAKVKNMLENSGFSNIVESAYMQSCSPVLRDSRYFDSTAPEMSFYIEAIK